MRGLKGKRIVVAGGATGIGAATAERLAAGGTDLGRGRDRRAELDGGRGDGRVPSPTRGECDRVPGRPTPGLSDNSEQLWNRIPLLKVAPS